MRQDENRVGEWGKRELRDSEDLVEGATRHVVERCRSRHISWAAVESVLLFGLHRSKRNADIYTLGWREVRNLAAAGHDVSNCYAIEVVCSRDGYILTTYRNRKKRALRGPAACRGAEHRRDWHA